MNSAFMTDLPHLLGTCPCEVLQAGVTKCAPQGSPTTGPITRLIISCELVSQVAPCQMSRSSPFSSVVVCVKRDCVCARADKPALYRSVWPSHCHCLVGGGQELGARVWVSLARSEENLGVFSFRSTYRSCKSKRSKLLKWLQGSYRALGSARHRKRSASRSSLPEFCNMKTNVSGHQLFKTCWNLVRRA